MTTPGGVSLESFKSISLETGEWIWGTAQGAFNEQATISQIVVDAAIGMIPLVGDATAVRDLVAVVIGLCDDPRKREDKFQWILLVVLLFALIPVIGGVVKGVGRLLVKFMGEAAKLAGAGARAARMAEAAKDIVAFLNRFGVGHAERWLQEFKFAAHQSEILTAFNGLVVRLEQTLSRVQHRMAKLLPQSVVSRMESVRLGLGKLKEEAGRRIPDAIKELDQALKEMQAYVRSGGETTSQATSHAVSAGAKNLSYADELRLLEGKGAQRTARGGLAQNQGTRRDLAKYYEVKPGFPDLTKGKITSGTEEIFPLVTTYSGTIVNRELQSGEQIYRVFGPTGATHGVTVGDSLAAGRHPGSPSFWGLNSVPGSAATWRKKAAVLDEWNHDGFIVIGTILPGRASPVRACTGTIAEQFGVKLGVQYLEGGGKQAIIEMSADVSAQLNVLGAEVRASQSPITRVIDGIEWEIRPTGWDAEVNGVHGYSITPGPAAAQTSRLGARESASKADED